MKRNRIRLLLALAFLLASAGSHAVVPGEVNYQGLLLDSGGNPVTGNADFVFSLFDVASGGVALWTESHDDVPVLDGVYDVVLGSTTPLTPGLVAGGDLHLEISVDGETLSPRQRLLAVPYALSAASVDGLSGVFVTQLFEHVSFDGQDPPNLDPSEGTDDVDGDTLPNFVDPDNDGDGVEDQDELAQGSDINLVTPSLTSVVPTEVDAGTTTAPTLATAR